MAAGLVIESGVNRPGVLTQFPDERCGAWHVLHTKSRQEKAIAETLTAMRVPHFLPLIRQTRYYGRRKQSVELPLFPSYLFLRGTLDDVYRADRTNRIAGVMEVVDQARLDGELRNLHQALLGGAQLDPYPYLQSGVRVEVRSGPFRGLQGVVDRRLSQGRLILQVDMLGRAVATEIDAALLDPIDDPDVR